MTVSQLDKPLDTDKLNAFLGHVVNDFGAALSAGLALLGDRLGLYRAMAGAGPLTSADLATRTELNERCVREWLLNQAAGGYVTYDADNDKYTLPDEHAVALTDEDSPFFVGGGFQVINAMLKSEPRIEEAFKTGQGMLWCEHDPGLFEGTERFFRPGYAAHLVATWLPAMDGVMQKLRQGGKVADIGCGHGASTVVMAKAFPQARFFGFDNHQPSIERARSAAGQGGVQATFEVAGATDFPGTDYDLICFFDCLHDMGDPVGAARHAREVLSKDGRVLMVEPMAGETVQDNINPVGRVYSAASTLCCTPNAMASGGKAVGTCASEAELRSIMNEAGFTTFRRIAETPFNRIFEAAP